MLWQLEGVSAQNHVAFMSRLDCSWTVKGAICLIISRNFKHCTENLKDFSFDHHTFGSSVFGSVLSVAASISPPRSPSAPSATVLLSHGSNHTPLIFVHVIQSAACAVKVAQGTPHHQQIFQLGRPLCVAGACNKVAGWSWHTFVAALPGDCISDWYSHCPRPLCGSIVLRPGPCCLAFRTQKL